MFTTAIHSFKFSTTIFLSIILLVAAGRNSQAESDVAGDYKADRVLGQADFTSNQPGIGDAKFDQPYDVAVDKRSGRVFVVDNQNSRVLIWDSAETFGNGQSANVVLGQSDFQSANPGVAAAKFNKPTALAVDILGNLFVSDTGNHRVLMFRPPFTNGMAASRVLGQPDFTSNTPNYEGVTDRTLRDPHGIAIDHLGRLFVADSGNHRVLAFPSPRYGVEGAFAVWGQTDFFTNNEGVGSDKLNSPMDVVVSELDAIYVADSGNHRVLVFTPPADHLSPPDPVADCVIGQKNFEDNDASSRTHRFNFPISVALDASNFLYVSDHKNNRIYVFKRQFFPSECEGGVNDAVVDYLIAALKGLSDQGSQMPAGLAFDAKDNLYLADSGNNRVLAFDVPVKHIKPQLVGLSPLKIAAGGRGFDLTVNAHFVTGNSVVNVNGVARPTTFINSSRLLAKIPSSDIANGGSLRISIATQSLNETLLSNAVDLEIYDAVTANWVADSYIGQDDFEQAEKNNPKIGGIYFGRKDFQRISASSLNQPAGVTIDPKSGRLFVVDSGNNRLLSWPNWASVANAQAADLVLGQPDFWSAVPDDDIAAHSPQAATLYNPVDATVDLNGNLYVADRDNHRVLLFQPPFRSGMKAALVFGQQGSFTSNIVNLGGLSADSLNSPTGVATDQAGNLYVADSQNHRVLYYHTPLASDTTADLVFGQPSFSASSANQGSNPSAQSLNKPIRIVVDGDGTLYVADSGNHRVLFYRDPLTSDRAADGLYGQPNFESVTPNPNATAADALNEPGALAIDRRGYLYIADQKNNRLLVFGHEDRNADSAFEVALPQGIAIDGNNNVIITDSAHRALLYNAPVVNFPAKITQMKPNTIGRGEKDFVIEISGFNFLPEAKVRWEEQELATTFVHAELLRATVPASYVATVGNFNVKVLNPAPNGGASNSLLFSINKASQFITFDTLPDRRVGDPAFQLTAIASSGLPVRYSASGICIINGSFVNLIGVGDCIISATQEGDNNFEAASPVVRKFYVSPNDTSLLNRKLYFPIVHK